MELRGFHPSDMISYFCWYAQGLIEKINIINGIFFLISCFLPIRSNAMFLDSMIDAIITLSANYWERQALSV